MMDLGSWGLKNRKLVYFLVVILVFGGLFAIRGMGKLEDPELKVKQALIVTTYPGASAHQVEMEVTDILEKSIRTMKNIDHVESRSLNDLSMITVHLSTLVPNDGVEEMWTILRRKVADAQGQLPEGASASVVKDDFGDVMGMFYALTSDGFSDREMGDYAELIKRNILEIEGVSRVDIYGQNSECIDIELYEDKIANLGLSPAEVLSTLSGQNQTVYSGYYEAGGQRLRVTVNDKYRNVEDIENLLLQGHQGDQFRLKDIARVSLGYETPARNEMSYDNQKALGIAISALTEADITQVGEKVEARIAELIANRLPAGIELHKVFFQPDRVNDSLNSFWLNLVESVLIVVLLLVVFMGFRSGMIIGINLIIIVLGSILILNFAGGTLQRVSLAAFILAMGMLVDNAIVILDGILIDMQRGVPRRKALTNIGRKTAMPLLGATLIAILAFFTSSKKLVSTMDDIQQYLTDHYPEAYVRLKRYNLMYKKYPIEVQFNGPDPAVLRDLTNQALAIMDESPAVFMTRSDWEPQTPVLVVDYNQPIARNVGLSRQDVGLSLLSATGGMRCS